MGHIKGLGTGAISRRLPNRLAGPQFLALLPFCHCLTARGVVDSYFRCWRKDCLELYRFGESFRNDRAEEKHGFRIQGLGGKVTDLAQKTLGLKGWRWSTRTASGAVFGHSLLGRPLLPQHSAEGIEIRHRQLC